jgi:hypothetical protein
LPFPLPTPIPILAAAFANPALLWGLGAASLPIIIHLLNRRKYREMPWAAMRFLLAALQRNRRRVQVEQWLLLAIRTLIVILVVAAMARPVLERLGAGLIPIGGRTHWVIALDGSLSMGHNPGQASRFDSAKALAAQLVKAADQGDGVSLVLLGDPPRAVIGAPAFSRDAVLRELDELAGTHGALDVTASFETIEEVLAASAIPTKDVVVVTDLQATSWRGTRAGAGANAGPGADEGLKRALAKIAARRPRSLVIDLGAPGDANRAVTDLRISPPVVTPNVPVTVQAVLKGYGAGVTGPVRVRLVIDGRLEAEETTTLAVGEDRALAFAHQFPAAGDHVVEVQLDADALPADDARRLVVPVREAVRVLMVDGDPKAEALRSEAAFLREAVAPEPEAGEAPIGPIRADVIGESELAGRDLSPYDVVVLANVARVTAAEADALDGHLRLGGGLVVFGGDQVVAESYNQLLHEGGKGPLPAAIGPPVGETGRQATPFELDPLGFRHPLVRPFAGEAPGVTASLTNVKTARYHRLILPPGSPAQVALAFATGDPAVIEAPRSRGRVIQVATTADTSWTSWPLHQSYPPVMEQALLLAASGRSAERNLAVGQPLVEALPANASGATAAVRRPAGNPAETRLAADGDVSLLRYDQTDLSGVYRATVGPPVDRELLFAANPDPAESDPARLDLPALRAALPGWEFSYDNDWKPLTSDAAALGHRGELHRPLLWMVLGLLLTESLLAWKFGHHAPRMG